MIPPTFFCCSYLKKCSFLLQIFEFKVKKRLTIAIIVSYFTMICMKKYQTVFLIFIFQYSAPWSGKERIRFMKFCYIFRKHSGWSFLIGLGAGNILRYWAGLSLGLLPRTYFLFSQECSRKYPFAVAKMRQNTKYSILRLHFNFTKFLGKIFLYQYQNSHNFPYSLSPYITKYRLYF